MDILPGFKLCRKGLHQYSTGKSTCPECRKKSNKEWRSKNKQKLNTASLQWNKKHKKRIKELKKKQLQEKPEQNRKHQAKWKKQNPHKAAAINAKRRANKKKALPAWANLEAIKKIYQEAVRLTKITGIPHEVDHIYPLQSKYLCGLHVETNLQILTKQQNLTKGNRTWPRQLECQKE